MSFEDTAKGEAIMILARTLYGEARGQPIEGLRGVANVVLNRVRSHKTWWGNDIVGVCLWPLQFSCWNHNDPNRKIMLSVDYGDDEFARCYATAQEAVEGRLTDNTFNSDHYINPAVADPAWARGLDPATVIGDHAFYNNVP